LRFIHAARLLVDHPLCDTGAIESNLRGLVRGATTQAFRNLVSACLEHDIDFLLLTGDALERSDYSIKARVELRRGFEELSDAGIQVFLIPGSSDPASVWNEFPELPSNVTVFQPETDDPVAVLRDGSVIASIRSLCWRQSWFAWDDDEPHADRTQRRAKEADDVETSWGVAEPPTSPAIGQNDAHERDGDSFSETESANVASSARHEAHREIRRVQSPADLRPNHFAIAIVRDGIDQPGSDPQADYLAVVGSRERTTSKGSDWLMHFPGGTQGRSPDERGLHGCSLVDLDSDGVIRCRFLPTAPVRWENFDLDIDTGTTFQQLVNRAQAACRELCGVEPTPDRGRLVAEYGDADDESDVLAVTQDHAKVSEALHAQACFLRWTIRGHGPLFEALFKEPMQAELIEWLDDDVHWPLEVPRLHRIRLIASEPAVTRAASNDDEQLDVPTEYFWRVDQAEPLGKTVWNELGGDSTVERQRFARIQAASPDCDAAVVFSVARRRGWKWFRAANM
jgi:DNA repair exonuclease SbcCD nuclease subunit